MAVVVGLVFVATDPELEVPKLVVVVGERCWWRGCCC